MRNFDPDPGSQKWPKNDKTIKQFHVFKCWMFFLGDWPLLLSHDSLSWKSENKNVAFC